MTDWFQHALRYEGRGWCVLPMGADKAPALKSYKRYHSERPTEGTLTSWFTVSGGLYCRDFDETASYEAWKASHPALAAKLPTVRTSRGFHVYARSAKPVKTRKLGDGELRGEKAFVVLPPSKHPSGALYEWVVPLTEGEVPMESPEDSGLNVSVGGKVTEKTETTEKQNGHQSLRLSVSLSQRIEAAIGLSLPTKSGIRDDNVFLFARALKAIAELKDRAAADLREHVRDWHKRALPVIGTKPFDATWAAFCHAWPRVEYPLGTSPLETIMEELTCKAPPPESGNYETPGIKMLVALCAELQRREGAKPFHLDCRSAARSIGTDHNTANKWLNMLAADNLLALVELGRPGRASRWRWLGAQ
jgi:hypothetical protein